MKCSISQLRADQIKSQINHQSSTHNEASHFIQTIINYAYCFTDASSPRNLSITAQPHSVSYFNHYKSDVETQASALCYFTDVEHDV